MQWGGGFMVNTISARQLLRIRPDRRHRILDLREPEEFAKGHYPGAENYPFDEIKVWRKELPKDASYYLLCEHGSLALRAAGELTECGYTAAAVVGGYRYLPYECASESAPARN